MMGLSQSVGEMHLFSAVVWCHNNTKNVLGWENVAQSITAGMFENQTTGMAKYYLLTILY